MNMVDHDRVPLELHLVIIPSRAIHVTTTVRIRMMSQLDTLSRPHQRCLGLDQLRLCIGHSLVGIRQRFHLGGGKLLRPYRSRRCIGRRGCMRASRRIALSITVSCLHDTHLNPNFHPDSLGDTIRMDPHLLLRFGLNHHPR